MKKRVMILKPCEDGEHGLFIEQLKTLKYSLTTQCMYTFCLNYFNRYLKGRNITGHIRVTKQVMLDYIQNMRNSGFADASVEIYFRPVRLFFGFLEERQKVFVNPAAGIQIKTPKLLPSVASEEEMNLMITAPDTRKPVGVRDRAFMELLYSTGMRRQEIIQLDLTDLNMQEATVRVLGKGDRERLLPIGKNAMRWLQEYISKARPVLLEESESRALWVKHGGGRINYECVQSIVALSRKRAGMKRKIVCHDFRRAFATHMLQHGAHPVDIQQLLGHVDLSHLRNYLRLTVADLKKMHSESRVGE